MIAIGYNSQTNPTLRKPGELVGEKDYKEHVGCLNVSPAIAKQVIAAA